jgi:hypothetical protein
MFDVKEIKEAISISNQTYNLIIWLNKALEEGFIEFNSVKEITETTVIAKNWLENHIENIPMNAKPTNNNSDTWDKYLNMFCSYFQTSFDIVQEPGKRYIPHLLRERNKSYKTNPYIKPKSISSSNKNNTQQLKLDYLTNLTKHEKIAINFETIKLIEKNIDHKLAIATYGATLIERQKGKIHSSTILALWREFAWEKSGSPKSDYFLEAEEIIASEQLLLNELFNNRHSF